MIPELTKNAPLYRNIKFQKSVSFHLALGKEKLEIWLFPAQSNIQFLDEFAQYKAQKKPYILVLCTVTGERVGYHDWTEFAMFGSSWIIYVNPKVDIGLFSCLVSISPSVFCYPSLILDIFFIKNPAYKRQSISRPMRIVAPIL